MDVFIVLLKNQNPQDMVDLNKELDEEFKYLGNQLSIPRLRSCAVCIEI
jgi:hypothetical protein